MKHSCNDDSDIKMSSNEHDAMELNEVLAEANNLTYYTHETELRMQRYNAMNMACKLLQERGLSRFSEKKHMSAK